MRYCSLHLPSLHLPKQFPSPELQPGLGDPSTDHTGKLTQSSPPAHPKPLEKHFPPEIGPERMSANKAPFIPTGTAGGDTRGLPALCASSCACAPWPRLGKGRRFSSFYTLLGFSPFCLLQVTPCTSLPLSPASHPRGQWLCWVSPGSPVPLPPPYSLVQVSTSPSCGRKHHVPHGHPAGHSSSWQRTRGVSGPEDPPGWAGASVPKEWQGLRPQCPAHGDHTLPRLCTMQPRAQPMGAGGWRPPP